MKLKNLINQQFGEWTVIGRAGSDTSGARWHVRCSCGLKRIVGSKDLISGHSTSCGCVRKKKRSLIGKRFGKLTVIAIQGRDENRNNLWICLCDCGRKIIVPSNSLLRGATKSCGCFQKERASQAHKTHGKSKAGEYRSWYMMLNRCENPESINYKHYGARGIRVCDRWHDFINFFKDMGERPAGMTIDRKNNNGDYNKSNCRWASQVVQKNNRRPPFVPWRDI